jgi:hypothetical protein
MGRLRALRVRANGRERTIRPSGSFLGWLPAGRKLVVVKKAKGQKVLTNVRMPASTVGKIQGVHRKFHGVSPQKFNTYVWPDAVGKLTPVGLIVSLIYDIPPGLRSPGKVRYQWNHEFGDHGERGHGRVSGQGNYPEKLMPLLVKDQKGNLFIKRRPGNKFYVTDWLYW